MSHSRATRNASRPLAAAVALALGSPAWATPCDPGTYSVGPFQCVAASPGFYVPVANATSQTPASVGRYVPLPGQSAQTLAQLGHFVSSTGQSAQTPAPVGSYVDTVGAAFPITSPLGRYVPAPASSAATPASAGFFVPTLGASAQTPAPLGFYVPGIAFSAATAASPGFFVGAMGQASQTPSPPGFYVPATGSSAPTPASLGFFVATAAASAQTAAPAGRYVAVAGATASTAASLGHFVATTGQSAQTPAAPGYYVGVAAATGSAPAPLGYYVPTAAASAPTPASPGFFVDSTGASMQSAAPVGFYVGSSAASSATAASAGHFVDAPAQSAQTPAPLGYYVAVTGASAATPASPGYFVDSTGASMQSAAPVGFYVGSSAASSATAASAGHFVDAPAQSAQTPAPLGHFVAVTGASAPTPAGLGTYVDTVGATSVLAAPVGYYVATVGASSATPAALGHFVAAIGQSQQTPAPVGSYVDLIAASAATLAQPGYFVALQGQSAQTPASPGFYVPGFGAAAAQACPEDTQSFVASVACRRAGGSGADTVGPQFLFVDPLGGHQVAAPLPVGSTLPVPLGVANASEDLGRADLLTRLSLLDLQLDPALGATGFLPGATLDEGETADFDLQLEVPHLGWYSLPFAMLTDQNALLGSPGDAFAGKVEGEGSGVDVGIYWMRGQDRVAPGRRALFRLHVFNAGNQAALDVPLSVDIGTGLQCSWSIARQGGGSAQPSAMNGGLQALLQLPAVSWIEYRASCLVDPDATGAIALEAAILPPSGDVEAGNDVGSVSVLAQAPAATGQAPGGLELAGAAFARPGETAGWLARVFPPQGSGAVGWLHLGIPSGSAASVFACSTAAGSSCPDAPADGAASWEFELDGLLGAAPLDLQVQATVRQYWSRPLQAIAWLTTRDEQGNVVDVSLRDSSPRSALFASGFDGSE